MAQTIEKSWSKTRESDDMHGKCNGFKICFFEIRKLPEPKCPESHRKSKKFLKK